MRQCARPGRRRRFAGVSTQLLAFRNRARVKNRQDDDLPAVNALWEKRQRRRLAQHDPDVEILGCCAGELAIAGEDLLRLCKREDDQPGKYLGTHGMEGEFEFGDDAEITAAAAQRPEKLRVVLLTRPKPFTVRSHHLLPR